MSYRQTFERTVRVHYSGTVHYPASQNGGTVDYSGTEYEKVYINIDVDTDPLEASVLDCNHEVEKLTGSVVATETAHVSSIAANSDRIGKTIINGFFKTVRSEISQEIARLTATVDATLVQLKKMADQCRHKQMQMASDYRRLLERYSKTFDDLNNELENRIHSLDEATFKLREKIQTLCDTNNKTTGAATVAIAGQEGTALQSRMAASRTKRLALGALHEANRFLDTRRKVDHVLENCLLPTDKETDYYAPVLYMEATMPGKVIDRELKSSQMLKGINEADMQGTFENYPWDREITDAQSDEIRNYYNGMVAGEIKSKRVADYMTAMFNLRRTASI